MKGSSNTRNERMEDIFSCRRIDVNVIHISQELLISENYLTITFNMRNYSVITSHSVQNIHTIAKL